MNNLRELLTGIIIVAKIVLPLSSLIAPLTEPPEEAAPNSHFAGSDEDFALQALQTAANESR